MIEIQIQVMNPMIARKGSVTWHLDANVETDPQLPRLDQLFHVPAID